MENKPIEHWKNLSLENIEGEEWRNVCGYEGRYSASSFGRIKSLKRIVSKMNMWGFVSDFIVNEKIIQATINEHGYLIFNLRKDNKSDTVRVHRIAALAFIPNPKNKRTINHKNGNKLDNRIVNLEWATHSENGFHSFRELGRYAPTKDRIGAKHPASKPVVQLSLNYEFISSYESAISAAQIVLKKPHNANILIHCKNGKPFHNFIWMHRNEYEARFGAIPTSPV